MYLVQSSDYQLSDLFDFFKSRTKLAQQCLMIWKIGIKRYMYSYLTTIFGNSLFHIKFTRNIFCLLSYAISTQNNSYFKKIQFSNDGLFNLKSICIYIRLFHCSKKEDLSKQECFPYSHAASENQRNKKTRNL